MVDFIDRLPTATMQRRDDIRCGLDQLLRFLATDIPASERAIALKHYEALRREALDLGIDIQP